MVVFPLQTQPMVCKQGIHGMVAKMFGSFKISPQQRGIAMDRATFALSRVASPKPPAHQELSPISTWVRRRLGNIDHEKRVFQIAGALFDMTRDLHGLGRRSRWALHAAALVHDVGRSVDPDDHPAIGSEMLLEDT